MTGPSRPTGGAVAWLTAQALAFGAMAAVLGIVANALFLDAYGPGWLPATYIGIAAAGIVVSGVVAGTAQRFDVIRIALVVLGGAAAGIGASWVLARGGTPWVSVPLLILFPIAIQLGFVFIGGQAGRLLDVSQIKSTFPRIVAGFPAGAVLGSLVAAQLVTWFRRTEDLLLVAAVVQAAFAALVWGTGRRYRAELQARASGPTPGASPAAGDQSGSPTLRTSFASRFVQLILAYQVLSALGSQLADYLVFDRATAQFPDDEDLAGFLAGYTALMNVASIAFLFLVAGPLLRRFGLRLGIAANPLVLTLFALAMIAVTGVSGGASFGLLAIASAARIADIALTDGTTRTSINATYQVVPDRDRLSVQAAVEGIGVPVAIGISGVLILILNALPFALAATIATTTIVCAVWTWIGILLYRHYGPALVAALDRRRLLDPSGVLDSDPTDDARASRLLGSEDLRSNRLALDLLSVAPSGTIDVELARLARSRRPQIRMPALAALAARGDEVARRRLAGDVRAASESAEAKVRLQAAAACAALERVDRAAAAKVLDDPDVDVRTAALDAVQSGDAFAVPSVLAALADARFAEAAAGAVGRLGDLIVPALAELLDQHRPPGPVVGRLLRAATTRSPARDEILVRHVGHRDRDVGLLVMERLASPEPASSGVATALDGELVADLRHAARINAAVDALADTGTPRPADAAVRRALSDELELMRSRVRANRLARHGSSRIGPALTELAAGGPRGALAREALTVVLGDNTAGHVLALLEGEPARAPRTARRAVGPSESSDLGGAVAWLRNLVEDPDDEWRSPWLRACAIHAASGRGVLDRLDLTAARALNDEIVNEVTQPAHPAHQD